MLSSGSTAEKQPPVNQVTQDIEYQEAVIFDDIVVVTQIPHPKLDEVNYWFSENKYVPQLPKSSGANVYAAAVVREEVNGVPWYVAKFPDLIDDWQTCLTDPRRHDLSRFIWEGSIEGGYPNGWSYAEAIHVFGNEGGNDLCQFNTQGSGACGYGQQLPCFPGALTYEGQFSIIMSKFQDGYRQNPNNPFWAHWYQWWVR